MNNAIYDRVLEMRGKDESFINPDISIAYDSKLDNVVEAATMIKTHMDKNNTILIYGDYDNDFSK